MYLIDDQNFWLSGIINKIEPYTVFIYIYIYIYKIRIRGFISVSIYIYIYFGVSDLHEIADKA
jgi:hypothetical protein